MLLQFNRRRRHWSRSCPIAEETIEPVLLNLLPRGQPVLESFPLRLIDSSATVFSELPELHGSAYTETGSLDDSVHGSIYNELSVFDGPSTHTELGHERLSELCEASSATNGRPLPVHHSRLTVPVEVAPPIVRLLCRLPRPRLRASRAPSATSREVAQGNQLNLQLAQPSRSSVLAQRRSSARRRSSPAR